MIYDEIKINMTFRSVEGREDAHNWPCNITLYFDQLLSSLRDLANRKQILLLFLVGNYNLVKLFFGS